MSAAFLHTAVMVTHCALSAQHIQRFAKADPCVYVGDFNIKPDSSMYQLLTQGDLDAKVLCALFALPYLSTLSRAPWKSSVSYGITYYGDCCASCVSFCTSHWLCSHMFLSPRTSPQHADYPPIEEGDNWKPALPAPLRSAYVTATGAEPDFTNYAKTRDEPVFIETLDYIFHSENVKIDSVLPLPLRDTVAGPLPNESEPSDHILMSARISVV
jgi:endonuclease/exonuclease/phosphatase family metal-dependent hydrolase